MAEVDKFTSALKLEATGRLNLRSVVLHNSVANDEFGACELPYEVSVVHGVRAQQHAIGVREGHVS
jgi:hypothetical protein